MNKRFRLDWVTFGKLRHSLKGISIPINLKWKVYDTWILVVMAYDRKKKMMRSEEELEFQV